MHLLQVYMSKLPKKAFEQDILYMKPLCKLPKSPMDPWYSEVPMGHNVLDKFLKKILDEANIDTTNKSNHSLRATAISRMHENNVPEKLIMERSGHLSRERLTSYERTTVAQHKAVCNTLSSVAAPVPLPVTKVLIHSVPPQVCGSEFGSSSDSVSPLAIQSTESAVKESGLSTEEQESVSSSGKEPALDVLKRFQFSNMSSCTFNINFKV